MPYYKVRSVSAVNTHGQKNPVVASRTLEQLGFSPKADTSRDTMCSGAIPTFANIVCRIESQNAKWFKLIRVEKDGEKAKLIQLDAGTYDQLSGETLEILRLSAKGSKFRWSVECESKTLDERAINVHGEVVPQGAYVARSSGKRIRASVVSAATPYSDKIITMPTASAGSSPEAERQNGSANTVQDHADVVKPGISEYVQLVLTSDIYPDPKQPRSFFDEEGIRAMAGSMKSSSQVVLIIVRPVPDQSSGKYMIIDGERRWRAAQLAGIKEMHVIVRPNTDDKKAFRQSVIANFNREGHTVVESLNVIKRLLADGLSATETWTACGKSAAWYYEHIAFEKLHPDLFVLMSPPTEPKKRLPKNIARKLAYLPIDEQIAAFSKIMSEPSKCGRIQIATELAAPYLGPSTRDRPSDHMRSFERFVLNIRGCNQRSFRNQTSAVHFLCDRRPDKVDDVLQTIDESIRNLTLLRQEITSMRREVAA